MILLIDNYDSFTWNLVQRLGELDPTLEPGRDLVVVRHDAITPNEAQGMDDGQGPSHVIISPGPCTPNEAGVSSEIISHFAGRVPVLGVCLGHQCMADLHGMIVERHPVLMHGKTSSINHDGKGLFAGVESPAVVARYHSLVVRRSTVPNLEIDQDGWEVSASCFDSIRTGLNKDVEEHVEVVMGLRRVWADSSKAPLEGVQFHPESFMTPYGSMMLWNFLAMGERGRQVPRPEIQSSPAR
jgi:anthranilate synthase/aminodeoxychorismate synthase-like glutamine amidotransferase